MKMRKAGTNERNNRWRMSRPRSSPVCPAIGLRCLPSASTRTATRTHPKIRGQEPTWGFCSAHGNFSRSYAEGRAAGQRHPEDQTDRSRLKTPDTSGRVTETRLRPVDAQMKYSPTQPCKRSQKCDVDKVVIGAYGRRRHKPAQSRRLAAARLSRSKTTRTAEHHAGNKSKCRRDGRDIRRAAKAMPARQPGDNRISNAALGTDGVQNSGRR